MENGKGNEILPCKSMIGLRSPGFDFAMISAKSL